MCAECHQIPCHPCCPNAPEPKSIYICECCRESICEGDDYLEIDCGYYHEECVKENALKILIEVCGARKGKAEELEDNWY